MGENGDSNEIGKVKLGIELATEGLKEQAKEVEKEAQKAGEKAAEAMGKGTDRKSDRIFKPVKDRSREAGEESGKRFASGFQKHAQSGMTKAASSIKDKMKGSFSGMGKMLIAGLSIKGLADFTKKCLELGSDLAEVQNVVDVTFTGMSSAVDEFAKGAAAQFGLSETMAKRFTGTFGAMSSAFGFAEKDAYEMSTALTGLAGDIASFYNIDQEEAFTKLKSVFTGETESLKELGVVMTQAALDQFALENGFGRTTAKMSEQEKVALRYRFVLDKLASASGDFSRTSGSWANQVRLLRLQFESLSAVIGQVLIAAFTPAIRALNSFMGALIKAANTFKSFVFSLFGKESADMAAGAGATFSEAMNDIGGSAGDAADSLNNVGDAASGAGNDAADAAKKIERSLSSFDKINKLSDTSASSGSGGSGGAGGSGAGGGAGGLGDTSSALKDTAYDVAGEGGPLDKVLDKLRSLKDIMTSGFWEAFGDTSVFESVEQNISRIGDSLKDIFTDDNVLEAANAFSESFARCIGKKAGAFASIGATVVDNITGGIALYLEQNSERIKEHLVTMFDIGAEISDMVGDYYEAIADIFTVFRSDDAKQITADLIDIFATAFSGIQEIALKFGRDIQEWMTAPLVDNKASIKTALENTIRPVREIFDSISEAWDRAWGNVQDIYDNHVHPLMEDIAGTLSGVFGNLVDGYNENVAPVLDRLSGKFKDVFEEQVGPMLDSVASAIGSLFDVLRKLWDTILRPLIDWISKNIMPVIAPIIEGLGTGLIDAIGTAADAISSLAEVFKIFADGVSEALDFVKDIIDYLKKVPENVEAKVSLAKEGWETVKGWVEEFVGGAAEAVVSISGNLVGTAWDTIKTTTTNLQNAAKTKAYTFKATATGAWKTLKGYVSSVVNKIKSKTATFTAKAAGRWETLIQWASNLKNWVKNRSATYSASSSGPWATIARNAKTTYDNVRSKVATFTAYASGAWDKIRDTLSGLARNFYSKTVTMTLRFVTTGWDWVSSKWNQFNSWLHGRADGGVYRGGKWQPIQSYASGGNPPGGQIFRARENGNPELVGTLKGSTAVMNNDQIVASVSHGVAQAISGLRFYSQDRATPHLAMITDSIRADTAELASLARQAAASASGGNMAEVVDILRSILRILETMDLDIKLDGKSVKDRIVRLINQNTKATGKCEIVV